MDKGLKIGLVVLGLLALSAGAYVFIIKRNEKKKLTAKADAKASKKELAEKVAAQIKEIAGRPSIGSQVNEVALAQQLQKVPNSILVSWSDGNQKWLDGEGKVLSDEQLEARFKGLKDDHMITPKVMAWIEQNRGFVKAKIFPLTGNIYGG